MIKVTDKFYIQEELMDYSVKKVTPNSKNKSARIPHSNLGYYKDIPSCLRAIIERQQHECTANEVVTIEQAIERFEDINRANRELVENWAKKIE